MNSRERDIHNRRVKRKFKQQKEEIMLTRRKKPLQQEKKILSNKMDTIEESPKKWNFSCTLLENFLTMATTLFQHINSGYVTVTQGPNESTFASILSMVAMVNVISDKRKADELSHIQAKQQIRTGQKLKQIPNTTRETTVW